MAKVPHGVEILPKISIAWVRIARTLQTDRQTTDRQTDGRTIAYSELELEFTFAKNWCVMFWDAIWKPRVRRTGEIARRWEAEDEPQPLSWRCRRDEWTVKHDCRYPGTVTLHIRWTTVDVVEPWRVCCDRPARYERNHRRTGPIQNDLTRKQNYNSKTIDDLTTALVDIET